MHISDTHVEEWQSQGYTVAKSFLTEEELALIVSDITVYFPTWDDFVAHRPRYKDLESRVGHAIFPYRARYLNLLSVHGDLISFVERALGTRDVFLTQSGTSAKYAQAG